MCGQTAYDWKTIPRFRRSAGTLSRRAASKKVSSPTAIRPSSGTWKPAIDISVVDFPQPDGPSSVKSSPSRTANSTWSSARCSANCLTRPSTWISGTVGTSDLEQLGAEPEHDHRDPDLEDGKRRDRTDRPL